MIQEKTIRLLDSQFGKFLAGRSGFSGVERDRFQELVCRLSMSLGSGDSCIPVTDVEKDLVDRSGLSDDGKDGGCNALCLVGNRLYMQRFFAYEKSLAEKIKDRIAGSAELFVDDILLDTLFVGAEDAEPDWQKVAAVQALKHAFLIISGGPGTGKTTTVVKILALLQIAAGGELRIALAAPTGKAAMRLQESISMSVQGLSLDTSIIETIPKKASTLHRLLGGKRYSPFFLHNEENPLMYDVVVIDEASMVDLALMSKVVAALRPGSRLILLGDKDQLASVESGTVLADMIRALPANTVELQRSYRFDKGIKQFAAAINRGDSGAALDLMCADSPDNVSLLADDAAEYGAQRYCSYMEAVRRAEVLADYPELFRLFHSFKILCALRHGPEGVRGLNEQVEAFLNLKGYNCVDIEWYPGRPVLITKNEYSLELYNGDIGLCLPDPENPEILKVWFERSDGSLQGLMPGRLSNYETVYALTIHKSQGAEIGEVVVVLPAQVSAVVTRELLYTAVTRAEDRVKIKTKQSVFDLAVAAKIKRHSGLADWL